MEYLLPKIYETFKSRNKDFPKRKTRPVIESRFIQCANRIVGGDYGISEENKHCLDIIMDYMLGIEGEIDLSKGIALYGDFGPGKSIMMEAFNETLKTSQISASNSFMVTSVEAIISDASKDGYLDCGSLLNTSDTVTGGVIKNPRHVLINEFGYTYTGKSYGTSVEEKVEVFLMKRYEIFQRYKKVTHITTNFTPNQLDEMYKGRLSDRFAEMFHFVKLEGKSKRK